MKKRNSLIELYRFLFAMNVVKNHGFFPYQGPYFSPGRISVEFFFVLSGFLLIRSMDKYRQMPFRKAMGAFVGDKLKPLAIPLILAIPFNILYKVLTKDYYPTIWGYLWYVHAMLVVFMAYFALRYFVKTEKNFVWITAAIFVLASVLHVIPFFYSWGYIRAAMGISLGMLISYLPPIRLKRQHLLWLVIVPVQAACLAIFLFGNNLLIEEILDLVLYPALVYFSFQMPVRNRVFDYLGGLSFGLYGFQCVLRPLRELGLTNLWLLFVLLVLFAVSEDGLKRLRSHRRANRRLYETEGI